jgi:DNA-binding response OmpR family regulator
MPRLSGRELGERVRARWPNVQLLFMSGYDRDQIAEPKRWLGASTTVLRKPFSIGELTRRIDDLLGART